MSHAAVAILTVFAGSLMMTAVLNSFLNYTEAQIGASCAHALLTHTTKCFECLYGDGFAQKQKVPNHRPTPVSGTVPGRRRWKLAESESLVWNIVRSIALAVRAFQLAHGDWRRRGVRCDEAGGRAISPGWYCDGTPLATTHMYSYNERGHASEPRAGGRRAPSCTHSTNYPTQPVICSPQPALLCTEGT